MSFLHPETRRHKTLHGQTSEQQNLAALFAAKVDYLRMCGEISPGMFWRRVIKLRECCLCQAETSGHLITDKWGLVLASARINPFCKHSYPNLLNMSLHDCNKPVGGIKSFFHQFQKDINHGVSVTMATTQHLPLTVGKEGRERGVQEVAVLSRTWRASVRGPGPEANHLASRDEYSCGRNSLLLPA